MAECPITELPKNQCAHCLGVPELDVVVEPETALDDKHDEHNNKAVPAGFDGRCPVCGDDIVVGEWILPPSEAYPQWHHEVCP